MRTRIILGLVLIFFSWSVYGDDRAPPASWGDTGVLPVEALPTATFAAIDAKALRAGDAEAGKIGEAVQFAVPYASRANLDSDGEWEILASGDRIWRMRFDVPGATDINVGFSRFWLPAGATVHIYDAERGFFQGPWDASHNKDHGEFWTPVVPGDSAVIELRLPADTIGRPVLELQQVAGGYRDWFGRHGGPYLRSHGSCNIDVACEEGDDWRDQIRSVGVYQRNGAWACTGSLINDVPNSLAPHFLTAHHCGVTPGAAPSLVVYWNYETPACGSGSGSLDQNQTGGTVLATRADVDMTLVLLDDDPDEAWDVYFSGWDRSNEQPGGAVAIHHPSTHHKSISFAFTDLDTTPSCIGANTPDTHWWINFWDEGTTEPGSSGSGIWHPQNGRLIGFLSGGLAACGNQLHDCYGKFAVAWDGTAASSRLRDWLDPDGVSPDGIDGTDPEGFNIVPEASAVSQCGFDDLEIGIEVTPSGEFAQPVTLAATELPAGVDGAFSVNVEPPPFATVLTVESLETAGSGEFAFAVAGEGGDFERAVTIAVLLVDDVPAVAEIVSPQAGETGVGTSPLIEWTAVDLVSAYALEIATDAAFDNIVYTAEVTATSHMLTAALSPDTMHYVRVRAANDCGQGEWSDALAFTTANQICIQPNAAIPDNDPSGIDSDIVITEAGEISALALELDITHTWVGDLIIDLTHVETGTQVNLVNRPTAGAGGSSCSGSNIDVQVDDAAPLSLQEDCQTGGAAYPESAYSPSQALAAFIGGDLAGTWRLHVSDNAGLDTGTLNAWCLVPDAAPAGPVPLAVQVRSHPATPENLSPGDTISGATPTVNDAGQLALRVNVAANDQAHGLWVGGDGSGEVVHELASGNGFMSSGVNINNHGEVVFEITESADQDGLWVYDPAAGAATRVTTLPFGTETWSSPRMDDDGIIGFRSRFSGDHAYHSVDPATEDAQLHAAEAGALDPDGPWFFLFTPSYGPERTITAKVMLSESGNPQQIRRFAADGSSELLVETVSTDPESPFSGFDNSVGINDQGDVAFIAAIAGGGRGVFLYTAEGVTEIARQDQAGPVTNIEFFAPSVNADGWVAFRAFDENADRAIFVGDGSDLVRVARRGDTVETSMGLAQINRPDNDPIVFGGSPAINNDGTVVFVADLSGAEAPDEWFGRALLSAAVAGGPVPQPEAVITPPAFEFEVAAGDSANAVLDIGNTGEVDLTWTIAQAEQDCGDAADVTWLSADPDGGTTPAGDSVPVEVTVNAAGLAEGDYAALLCVSTNDPGTALSEVPVSLSVAGEPEGPVAEITPDMFAFELPHGGAGSDILNIGNVGTADLEWQVLTETPLSCEWDTTLGNPGGSLNALGLWGDTLYVGGSANTDFNGVAAGVAEVDVETATVTSLGSTELVDGFVTALVPFDDGGGERLFITGSFNGIRFGGAELPDSRGVVAWDGSETVTLEDSPFAEPLVFAQAAMVYDGQLVIGGAGGAVDPPQLPVLTFWDGSEWTTFRNQFEGLVAPVILAVEEFQGDLYFAGRFGTIEYPEGNVVESFNIMGFDGENFFPVGGGLMRETSPISQVLTMKTFDDGSGEALYIGGRFDTAVDSGESMFAVAKWDGETLSAVGNGFPMPDEVRGLEVYDGGNGPALYAVGNFTADTLGQPIERMARLTGGEWVEVAGGIAANPNRTLALPGGGLAFAGNFDAVGGVSGIPGAGPSHGFAELMCVPEPGCDGIDQIPWLEVLPDAGVTPPGGSDLADLLVDAAGLAAGEYQAQLCVATNDPAAPRVGIPVTLNVEGHAPGVLQVTPDKLHFGDTAVGQTATASFTVTNAAGEQDTALVLEEIVLIHGQDAFAVTGGSCVPEMTLMSAESCTVEVAFTPAELTAYVGAARITTADGQFETPGLAGQGTDSSDDDIFSDRFE